MDDLDTIYKALRLVPDFDGNPNILTRFINLCDQLAVQFCAQDSSDLNKCALLNGILNKVVGPAARLINANGIPVDWKSIRSALINNFADQRDETALYNDLAILRQGSNTPQEYYERCQNLFSTIMTYVTLHDTLQTTIDSKRDLYKKLTLQAFVRGLNDPLGSRIRCMRPETIEKALEYVHEEVNILYLQSRNERLISHYVTRQLPQNPALTGHDWRKFGNPNPSNYFKTREMNYNYCTNEPSSCSENYIDYYEPHHNSCEFVEYQNQYEYEPTHQEYVEFPQTTDLADDNTTTKSTEPDFQKNGNIRHSKIEINLQTQRQLPYIL